MPLSKAWLHCAPLNDIQNNSFKFSDNFSPEVYSNLIKNVEDPGKIPFMFLIIVWILLHQF